MSGLNGIQTRPFALHCMPRQDTPHFLSYLQVTCFVSLSLSDVQMLLRSGELIESGLSTI